MAEQLPFSLRHQASFDEADFMVAEPNRLAHRRLMQEDLLPPGLLLVGEAGSGKSHLAHMWARARGARPFKPGDDIAAIEAGEHLLVEDIDRAGFAEEALFHLFNWCREVGAVFLMTSRVAPARLDITLPDLASRLEILPRAQLGTPDDMFLGMILAKHMADRQLQADANLIDYLVPRMERGFEAAAILVDALDRASLSQKRRLTTALARQVLAELDGA